MIATVRKIDWNLWWLTTSHGADLAIECETRDMAEQFAEQRCKLIGAWPLTIDVVIDDRIATTRIIPAPSDQDAPFTLCNDPPAPRRFHSDPQRQRVLFTGLNCLAGQLDLIEGME